MYKRRLVYIVFMIFVGISCDSPSKSNIAQKPANKEVKNDVTELIRGQDLSRGIWQKPELVIGKLGNIEDKTIADIGAGTGYFSFRLLPKSKKVIAIDIDMEALDYMNSVAAQLPEQYASKFETRKASSENSNLIHEEADIILLVNTYIYLPNRVAYLSRLNKILPKDAELIIIDFKKKKIPLGPAANEKVALSQVETEIENAGFTLIESDDQSLDYQYIVHATKK